MNPHRSLHSEASSPRALAHPESVRLADDAEREGHSPRRLAASWRRLLRWVKTMSSAVATAKTP